MANVKDVEELFTEIDTILNLTISDERRKELIDHQIYLFSCTFGMSIDYIKSEVDNHIRLKKFNEVQLIKHKGDVSLLIQNLLLDKRNLISQREQWVVTYQISERWELKQEALSYTENLDNAITSLSEKIDALFEKIK